ncbi:MAG: GNAT family N-acetyltransferase [Nocardioidaceae bacterium]
MLLRPMRADDVVAVERLTDEEFHRLDVRTRPADWPAPNGRSPAASAAWVARTAHLLAHDAGGCWVAEDDDGLVGAATSLRREVMWVLSTYAVRGRSQGTGVGTKLLEAALGYSRGASRGMICASHDPGAYRRYRAAGFTLHPTALLWGPVARSLLPVVDHVRDGSPGDVDLCDSVDRQTRGAGHGVDHDVMAREHRLVVVDDTTGSGYCYVRPNGSPYLLAASNRRTAQRLMWEALAASDPEVPITVGYVSAEQDWAVDVAMAARLEVHNRGYLGLRGLKPPAPYLPSTHLL